MTGVRAEPARRRSAESESATRARPQTAVRAPAHEASAHDGGRPVPPRIREQLAASFGAPLEAAEEHAVAEQYDAAGLAAVDSPAAEPAEAVEPDAAAWTLRERIVQRALAAAEPEAAASPTTAPEAHHVTPTSRAAEPSVPALVEAAPELEAEESPALALAADAVKKQLAARTVRAAPHVDTPVTRAEPAETPNVSTSPALELVTIESAPETDAPAGTVEAVARGPPRPDGFSRTEVRLSHAPIVQTKLSVSNPADPLEHEADAVALRVLRGGVAFLPSHGGVTAGRLQRALPPARGPPAPGGHDRALPRSVASVIAAPGGGSPLDTAVRARIEPHVGVDLGHVRIRQGPDAAAAARDLHARAFTSGSTIFLAAESSPADVALMAHEATHVAQQQTVAAARTTVMRDILDDLPDISVDDLIPDWILDGVRSAVLAIPGYTLLTYIAGTDPLTDEPVPASPEELIEALLTRGPFGAAVGAVLSSIDVLGEIFDFVSQSLVDHDLTFARLKRDIDSAWDELSVTNGISGNVAILQRYVDALLADVDGFIDSIVERVLEIVRSVVAAVAEPLLQTDAIAPYWNLAKKVLHYDALLGVEVDAPTAEIIADFLRLIGEDERLAQMEERGTLQSTADWLDVQLATFVSLVLELGVLFSDAWAAIQPENLPDLFTNLESLAQRAFGLVVRVGDFAATLMVKILELVKEALLEWLSEVAHGVPGFHLLTVIIGQNPFTGEEVLRTAENLIKGFITLLPGGEETYDQLAESGVISSAAERIEGAMERLGISLELITGIFTGIWDTLTLDDLLDPIGAFGRVLDLFGGPLLRLAEFVLVVIEVVVTLILRLMNFPTELLGSVISNTMSAIADITRDPVGFLLNMLEALKVGLTSFFDNILTYLTDGLVAWLFRGLGQLGITIPTDFSLASVLDLIFQVLGLTIEHLWEKLAEHIGPERVAMIREALDALSGAWSFIQDVQRDGLSAIGRFLADQLGALWSMLLDMALDWIMKTIVVQATIKLLTFIDPSGIMAVINSCIAFYNAVVSAIEYLRDMLEVLNMYVSTLAAVAAGNIAPGAQMIERGLAAIIPIAIGFLAKQVGLGSVPEKIAELIGRLREIIDEAIDWLIEQALRLGAAALNAFGLGPEEEAPAEEPAADGVPQDSRDVAQPFTFGDEPHEIKGHVDGARLRITVASNGETLFWDKVDLLEINYARVWARSRDPVVKAKGDALHLRIQAIRQMETALLAQFDAALANPDDRFRIEQDGITALRVELSSIADDFQLHGMNLFFEPPQHRFQDYPEDAWGRGLRAEGVPISSASRGQGTDATGRYIPGINLRPNQQRGHLVANVLGGLGDEPKHLTPLDVSTNTAMRVGPELQASRFIYNGDPSQSLHYVARAQYRTVGDFQSWLAQDLAPAVIPANAGQRMWTTLLTGNPTPANVSAALGMPVGLVQYDRIIRGLAYYFLTYSVDISISNVNTAAGNVLPIPASQPVPHTVAQP